MNGDLVLARLLELGMSREKLAADMGVSIATVWNMIRGKKVHEVNLRKAAKVLRVLPSDLRSVPTEQKLA